MRFLPKKHFRWREPKEFVKLTDAFARAKRLWWHRTLGALISAASLMLIWFLARFNPRKQPPPFEIALPMFFVGGVVFAYVIPWIISLCPVEITFFEKNLLRIRGNAHRTIKYSDIASFSWRIRDDFSTLVLKLRPHNREVLIGVPLEISREAVSQFLLKRHIQSEPSTSCSSSASNEDTETK